MGRFDALTHIEENQPSQASSLDASPPASISQHPVPKQHNPINTTDDNTYLLANQQTTKPASKKTSLLANQQTSKETNQQTSIPTNMQIDITHAATLSTKEKKKYGTYLREDSISAIQVHAIQTKQKDHEVLQQAVDAFFRRIK